jgi:signal transduction histidine kinase
MINLLSNAAKFTPEGGKVAVEAGVRADGSLGVRVDDTGIGIKPEDLERLFEVFWQGEAPDVRRHEGSGLGLAISKRLVEMHGGTLTIRSAVGRGTSAEIRLPPFRRAA